MPWGHWPSLAGAEEQGPGLQGRAGGAEPGAELIRVMKYSKVWRGTDLQSQTFLQGFVAARAVVFAVCVRVWRGRGLRLHHGVRMKVQGCLSCLRGCCCVFVQSLCAAELK